MQILVYIPCHVDFQQALNQAGKLKKDFQDFLKIPNQLAVSLRIVISVNAYSPSEAEKEEASTLCDRVIYNGVGYLGDLNIANGYLIALDEKPDLLWILSTNDQLVENAINNVLTEFIQDDSIDVLVTNLTHNKKFIARQIIDPEHIGYSWGLVSGVIYRLKRLTPYIHNGLFMIWTGWSQMAVLQCAMDGLGGLTVKTIPLHRLYRQYEQDLPTVGRAYAHSRYGMLVLGLMLKTSRSASRKYTRVYILKNFYVWHLNNRKWNYSSQLIEGGNYLAWNQQIAEALIRKNSFTTYYLYKILKQIPFERLYKYNRLIQAKRKFDSIVK